MPSGRCEGLLHCTASLIERFIRRDKNVSDSQSLNIRPWVEQPLNVRSRGHLCFYDAPTQTSLEATDLSDTVSVTVGTPGDHCICNVVVTVGTPPRLCDSMP